MEQIGQPVKPKRTTAIAVTVLAFLLFLTASTMIFGQNIAAWGKSYAQAALTEQIKNYLGREVSFENIVFAPAGQVGITGVAVYDGGAVVAKISTVRVYYNWHWDDFNFKKFNFKDLAYIERIFLQKCEFFIDIHEENNQVDLKPLLAAQKSGWDDFRGQVQFGAAKINLNPTRGSGIIIDEINGEIDFKNPEDITINLAGSFEKTPLAVKGDYFRENGELSLASGAPFDLAKFNLGRLSDQLAGVDLKEGVLEKVALKTKKTAADVWQFAAEGEFSGLSVNAPAAIDAINNGRGSFTADNAKIIFADLSFTFAGQRVAGEGNVLWQSGLDNADIDFIFSLPVVDPSNISPRLAGEQPVAVDVKVAGSVKEPVFSGQFSASRLNLGSLPVSNITGNFAYAGNYRTVLQDIKGESLGGTITAVGDLYLDNHACELDIAGKKLDGFLILGKDIRGELDFSGHLSSRDKNVIARGNFVIRDGSAYGTAFQVFNGFFVRQDDKSDISDIAIRTPDRSIYPDALSKEALSLAPAGRGR